MTDILVNSDELIAEALTFYASDLRQQAEFCAYMMDEKGMAAAREKVEVIEQLLLAHERMNADQTTGTSSGGSVTVTQEQAQPVQKNPVGFTSQKIQASPKNPKPVVGMPKTNWDVV